MSDVRRITFVIEATAADLESASAQAIESMRAMAREAVTQSRTAASANDRTVTSNRTVARSYEGTAGAARTAAEAAAAGARTTVTANRDVQNAVVRTTMIVRDGAREQIYASDTAAAATRRAAAESERSAARIERGFGRAGSALTRSGRLAAISLAGAAIGAAALGVHFEASTMKLHTQAGVSLTRLQQLRDGILQMAPQVGAMPDRLTDGLYHVVSSMDALLPKATRTREELQILQEAARGAAIGGSDLSQTAYVLSSAMNALGRRGDQARQTMAELNAIVGTGDMRMQDMVGAMSTGLIPAAENFGISLRSVGAALAFMVDRGTPAQLAATRLRMSFSLLGAPTKQSARLLTALGMSSDDVRARTEAMTEALQKAGLRTTTLAADLRKPNGIAVALNDLNSHLRASGLNAEASAALISRAFGGGRSGTAIMELVQHTEVLNTKYEQQGRVVKTWGEAWRSTQQTVQQQLKELEAGAIVIGTRIGEWVLPKVNDLVHSLRDVFGWLGKNRGAAKALGDVFIGVLAVAMTAWFVSLGRKLASALREVALLGKNLAAIPGRLERWIAGSSGASTAAGSGARSTIAGAGLGLGGLRGGFGLPGSEANPLFVIPLGGGIGGAPVGGIAGETATAERTAMRNGGLILPTGVAGAEETAAGAAVGTSALSTLRAGLGSIVGKLAKGAGIAGVGVMGSQLAGEAIGGHTGHVVSGIGTGAAIGAGIGSMIGPEGTVGGAIVGGLIGLFRSISHSMSEKIATEAVKGLRPEIKAQYGRQIQADAKAADKSRGNLNNLRHNRAEFETPQRNPFLDPSKEPSAAAVQAARRKAMADEQRLGRDAAKAWESGWDRYALLDANHLVDQFDKNIARMGDHMTPRARDAAARSMIEFAHSLEANGRLPRGATDAIIKSLEARYPGLASYLKQIGEQSNKNLARTLGDRRVQQAAHDQIAHVMGSFQGFGDTLRALGGNTQDQWRVTMAFLISQTQHGTRQSRQIAAQELTAMVEIARRSGGDFANWMALGTARGAGAAATNLSSLTQVFAMALGSIAGQTQDISKTFGVRAVQYVARHPKEVVATGLQAAVGLVGAITRADGGYVGHPGERGRDTVHAIVGRGEAIVNHHQQGPVEVGLAVSKALGVQPYGSLSALFRGEQRPHYLASGGFAGGVGGSHLAKLLAAANRVSGANLPYSWGGGHEQPAQFEPFDCSGAVSYAVQQAGYRVPTSTSSGIGSWGFPSGPGEVTIFYNPVHTFMRILGRYWGTSGFARPGGGAGWFNQAPGAGYLSRFASVHLPDLGASGNVIAPRISPDGPLTRIANAASRRAAAAANAYLDKLGSRSGAGGGGGQALNDAGGRRFAGRVSTFGPPGEPAGGTAYGHSSAEPGIAIDPAPPTGWDSPLARSLAGHRFRVRIGSHVGILPVIDKGPSTNRTIDVTGAGAAQMGIDPSNFPTDSFGTADLVAALGGFAAAARGLQPRTGSTNAGTRAVAAIVRRAAQRVHQKTSRRKTKHKGRKRRPKDAIARALSPFSVIPDVNNLPGNIDSITAHIGALSDQEGLLSTIASNGRNFFVLPGDMDALTPTLQPGESIYAGMRIVDAQALQQHYAARAASSNPLLDLQGQLLDWAAAQADHALLTGGDQAILSTTARSTGITPLGGQRVADVQVSNLSGQIDALRGQVHTEQKAIATINRAIRERLERRRLVEKLAHTAKRRLDTINRDLRRLTSRSLQERLAAARDKAASNTRVFDAQTEVGQLGDLIAHERSRPRPDRGQIEAWEQRRRDLEHFIHGERAPTHGRVTNAELAIVRNRLQNEKRPIEEDLRLLAGNETRIGSSGMLGKIREDLGALRSGRKSMEGDISTVLQSGLPNARLERQAILDSLPETERPILPPDSGSADNSTQLELQTQLNTSLAQALAISEAYSAVFAGFMPMIPRFLHGGRVLNDGLALVHAGEWISPSAQGPYGSQLVGASSASSPSNLHVHLHGDTQQFVRTVEAIVDERMQHPRNVRTLSASIGRRQRMIVNAPGGAR